MTTPADAYTDALERALGRVVADARAEAARQAELVAARADALLARIEAGHAALERRTDGLAAEIDARVAEGIAAGLGAIEARMAERIEAARPDPAPVAALAERVVAVEAAGAELASMAERLTAVEARGAEIAEWQAGLELPEVPDLEPLREDLAALRSAIPEVPDVSGLATREEVEAVRAAIPEIPEPRDWSPEIGAAAERAEASASAATDAASAAVAECRERLERHPGVFPQVRAWTDGVHYAGDLRSHDGALWQARRDTGKAPPHEDWSQLVAKGDRGEPGRSFTPRGTHDEGARYEMLDVAIRDGSAFVALRDDPGPCPGDGWQVIAVRGSRGKPGTDGAKGERGKPGSPVVAIEVDDNGLLTVRNGDGSTAEVDLYPLLARLG